MTEKCCICKKKGPVVKIGVNHFCSPECMAVHYQPGTKCMSEKVKIMFTQAMEKKIKPCVSGRIVMEQMELDF
jgi:hypothetical protein